MKTYAYNAVDYSGQTIKGTVTAETAETATKDISGKGLYVVSLDETAPHIAAFYLKLQKFRVGRPDILEFTHGFSVMLGAGIPILTCLDDLIASTSNESFKPIVRDIQQRLERGSSVSAALAAHGGLFPDIVRTLVAVGEETGRLEESLREAAAHLQRLEDLAAAIRKALMYPIFAFLATLGALVFWMVFVIPSLTGTLKGMGVKLPALTLFLISTSGMFQANWKFLLLGLFMLPPAIHLMGKNQSFRYVRDLALLKLPIIRAISFNKLLATLSEQFRILIASGVPIERLFDLVIPALDNEYIGVNLLKAKLSILNGSPISESFEKQQVLPQMVISKIRIGETSGSLDKQFEFLAKYYSAKLDDATINLGKAIEPLVMTVIGGLFAIIIMGLLLPIYDLVSNVGKI